MSNAKMSNRVLIRTVPGEMTLTRAKVNHLKVLLCISSWLFSSEGKRVVCFFGMILCTNSVDTGNRGDSLRMILTISLL